MRPERSAVPGSSDPRVQVLEQVEIFADLRGHAAALITLAALMREQSYRPGQTILTEGESGAELYLLVHGEAGVYKSTSEGEIYRVAILKGERHPLIGEGGLLGSDARSATIRADGACRCLVLGRDDFERFSSEHPEWGLPVILRIARAVMSRLHKANDDLMLLYNALVAEIRGK
jgi:CRP/FNR family cyclic AMP-dependent transcriptional regulator